MAARRYASGGKAGAGGPGGGVQYCQIATWLEKKAPELLAAFKSTCLDVKLRPRSGDPSVTLLVPNAALLKEVLAAVDSDTEAARKLLGSLVLLNGFASAEDFAQAAGDEPPLPAGTLNRTRYDVRIEGRKILLNGAAVEPEADFRPTPEMEGRISVWRLKDKPEAPTKPYVVAPRARRPRPDEKTGAAEAGPSAGARRVLADRVLAAAFDGSSFNPWLAACLAVLGALEPDLLAAVTPLLDFNPIITFYLLAQPYCTNRRHLLIPDSVFASESISLPGGGVPHTFAGDAREAFKAYFTPWWAGSGPGEWGSEAPDAARKCAKAFARDRDQVRGEVSACSSAHQAGVILLGHYNRLVGEGTLSGHASHVPAECLRLLSKDPEAPGLFKLHQDELRFRLRIALFEFAGGPDHSAKAFEEHVLGDVIQAMPGNSLREELTITAPKALSARDVPTGNEDLISIMTFANATDLLYFSVPPACAGEAWGRNAAVLDDLPFNSHRAGLDSLEATGKPSVLGGGSAPWGRGRGRGGRLFTGGGDTGGAGGFREGLSAAALAELGARIRQCGGTLPPEVLALLPGAPGGE
jgi:hypothetical protein